MEENKKKKNHTKPIGITLTQDEWIAMAKKVHGDTYDYSKVKYVEHDIKVTIICKEHGEFLQTPSAHTNTKQGCPVCGRLKSDEGRRIKLPEMLKRFREAHGDYYDYSKVVLGNRIKDKIIIICPEHGEFLQAADKHLRNRNCPKCSGKYQLKKDEWFKLAKEIHGDKYDYSKTVYPPPVEAKGLVLITCKEHGDFTKRARAHVSYGHVYKDITHGGCPICSSSLGEQKIRQILIDHNIEFIREYKLLDTNYRYDFYLPKLNILIEYDGLQHFFPVNMFGGNSYLLYTKENDEIKNKLADSCNIPLIRIHYTKVNILEEYLFQRIYNYYKYKIEDRYYKTFLDLVKGEQLPGNTKPKDVEQYKLYKQIGNK